MMNYDPFQTYSTLGQLYGVQSPIGLQHPVTAQLSGINPIAALNPVLGLAQAGIPQLGQSQLTLNPVLGLAQAGIPQLGQSQFGQNPQQGFINPQQLQLASLLATNPLLAVSLLNNPLLAATLHSQQAGLYGGSPFAQQQYPQLGQQQYPQIGQQLGHMGSPFGQIGYPLAPQSWIGQGAQFGQRPFQGQGFSPWGY